MAALFPYAPTTAIFITNWNGRVIYSGPEDQCPQRYLKMLGAKLLPEAFANLGRWLPGVTGTNPPQVTETGGASATYLGLVGAL
jgi:hypothetical protein